MKRIYILLLLSMGLLTTNAQTPDDFVMTFEVDISSGLDIQVPITGTNYTIDFGDGTVLNNQTTTATHIYNAANTYTVIVSGSFHQINFGHSYVISTTYAPKLKSVKQWGTTQWATMSQAFSGCDNLIINAIDIPDLSQVTSMYQMFVDARYFNSPINNWDVSNVSDMGQLFKSAETFNQPLNDWDVSNVTNMEWMFEGAKSFNQPLNDWDVSNVTNMFGMFQNTTAFNQPLNNWDVSNVIQMNQMFSYATAFNQPLNNWDVSNVTNIINMFSGASTFNQPLNNWDVSNVTNMRRVFVDASAFNQPLNNWNVSNVTDMREMFQRASLFNHDISSWIFNDAIVLDDLVSNSGLDVDNYDKLLLKFAQLGLLNKTFTADLMQYCNTGTHNYLTNTLGWVISGDFLSTNCPDNSITGNLLYDENANGCNPGDAPLNNILLKASDGTTSFSTFPNTLGKYTLNVYAGTYTIEPVNLPNYFSVTPSSSSATFMGSNGSEMADFCLTANQTIKDLNITIIPIREARPGFEAKYRLVVQNMGTQTVANAMANLTFDDTRQTFVSAMPSPASTTTDQLKFNITNLMPLGSSVIDFTMKTFTPPTVNGGDLLNFTASVTPDVNDNTPADNKYELEQTVVNAYDPNDKQVLQGDEINIDQVGEYLHYLIRFQNTGTASAINVRLEDVLDTTLDWNTLQIINASDSYRTKIMGGNRIEFIFENINLPHEAQDSAGSHGFIAYKIKPKTNIQVGDSIIGNKVNIYFDYNLPIITNAVKTKVIEDTATGGITQFELTKSISVYPNPAEEFLYIEADKNIPVRSAKIYSVDGRQLLYQEGNLNYVNLTNLNPGILILQIETDFGIINKKVIKMY